MCSLGFMRDSLDYSALTCENVSLPSNRRLIRTVFEPDFDEDVRIGVDIQSGVNVH